MSGAHGVIDFSRSHNHDFGNQCLNTGRYDEAVESYLLELRDRPSNVAVYRNLGWAYDGLGDAENARKYFQLAKEKTSPDAWWYKDLDIGLARAAVLLGDHEAAFNHCQLAHTLFEQMDPSDQGYEMNFHHLFCLFMGYEPACYDFVFQFVRSRLQYLTHPPYIRFVYRWLAYAHISMGNEDLAIATMFRLKKDHGLEHLEAIRERVGASSIDEDHAKRLCEIIDMVL